MPHRRPADYCRWVPFRRIILSCALALAVTLAAGASLASATVTLDIYGDYANNRVIDGHYSASDLQAALAGAKGDKSYDGFARAVSDAYDRDILGLAVGSEPRGAQDFQPSSSSILPEPQGAGARDQPPWPFLALSVLAGMLVVSGAGSSIYRRARR